MMHWLGRQLARKSVARLVVLLVTVLAAFAASQAAKVQRDDNVLAFLPKDNIAVTTFDRINNMFGGLNVAIVGIAVEDPLDPEFFGKLKTLTQTLDAQPTIAKALSLSNMEDFVKDPVKGGVETNYLVTEIPKDETARKKLRERVMGLDHVVGNVVARDGKGVIIYCFLRPDAEPRRTAAQIRQEVERQLPGETIYWGGAPFVAGYIYDITETDMRTLIPWAVAVILFIVVASFRDPIGSLLALGSTGLGILFTYGWMGTFGINANIVLSSMPVILFAVGSAYGTHVLVRYYTIAAELPVEEALPQTLAQIGPTVLAAGLTTVAGLLSFLAMDIEPMQQFGVFTAVGISSTLVLSITFVPAVIRLLNLKSRRLKDSVFRRALVSLASWARRHRRPVIGGLVILAGLGSAFAGQVEARMENRAFFAEGSPPEQADRFLREQFGGSMFIQILVAGDMNEPAVVRQVQGLADAITPLPHVSAVLHVGQVLAMATDAMADERRIPTERGQINTIYRFVGSKTAVKQLVTYEKSEVDTKTAGDASDSAILRNRALIHIKIDTDEHVAVSQLLEQIETLVAAAPRGYTIGKDPKDTKIRQRRIALATARIAAVSWTASALRLDENEHAALGKRIAALGAIEADSEAVEQRLAQYLGSEESMLEEEQHRLAKPLAHAVVKLGATPAPSALETSIANVLGAENAKQKQAQEQREDTDQDEEEDEEEEEEDDSFASDLSSSLSAPLADIWRRARASARAPSAIGPQLAKSSAASRARLREGTEHALLDLDLPWALLPDPAASTEHALSYELSGVPVLYRGLSESVTKNQVRSLALALALVLLIMMVLFRSILSGLLAACPTVLTLLVIYGAMGAMNIHLDIGTSMLASIIIGAGVDYAVHLLAAWRVENGATDERSLDEAARRAAERAGPSIWTNALMVGAGFYVLTLGEARPLQTVGGLTAAAMVTAALATFVALPALARRASYRRAGPGETRASTANQ